MRHLVGNPRFVIEILTDKAKEFAPALGPGIGPRSELDNFQLRGALVVSRSYLK